MTGRSTAHSLPLLTLAALLVLLIACGDDDTGMDDARDGSPDGGHAEDASMSTTCTTRCEPDEAVADAREGQCECSDAPVRMRLGSLDEGFYNQPWPLDTRVAADGTLELEGLPTAPSAAFINDNLETIETRSGGFSTTGAILLSLTGSLDDSTLPRDAAASLADDASVYLLDVDPASDTLGERSPIECAYRDSESAYNPKHFLSCLPYSGFPLRPDTLHALVLTTRLRDTEGMPLVASQRLRDALDARDPDGSGADAALTAAMIETLAPLADQLLADGVELSSIVGATVFRTQDPTAELRAIAAHLESLDVPQPSDLAMYSGALPAESGNYSALQGTFDAPIYQQGETPYTNEGGDLRFEGGEPVLATTLAVRFALTLPDGDMPDSGWPLALYHHGTGGDAYSHIRDGTAFHLADAGVAVLGLDAPVHGTRKPAATDPVGLFFNISNVLAMRDNIRQGAIDLLSAERFAVELDVTAADSPSAEAFRFDRDNIFVMGHSQGSLTAPLMLPFARHARGAMLSGAGASISGSILYKTEPIDLPTLARAFLGLPAGERLDAFHPVLALVQAFSDSAESSNYVPYYYRWSGGRGIDLWVTSGLLDREAPPQVTDALAVAAGLPPVGDFVSPIEGLVLRALDPIEGPVRENVSAADGQDYTAGYTQYADEGHFLIFQNPAAEARLTHWFRTLASGGHAELGR